MAKDIQIDRHHPIKQDVRSTLVSINLNRIQEKTETGDIREKRNFVPGQFKEKTTIR